MPEERQRCLDAGMNGHITKPIEPDAMLHTLARWRTLRVPATGAPPWPVREIRQDRSEQIPEAAGLDVSGALERLAGNSRLYLSLLAQFAAQQADADRAIQQALASGDRGQAQSRAHMVRGVAGNLGAVALGAAAGVLEAEIAANSSDDVIAAHVAVFTAALTEAVDAMHMALTASGGRESATRDADPEQTIALLTELAQMAADDDATLPERFLEVHRDLVAALTAAELAELATGINAYEFARVRALAIQLAGGMAAPEDAA
jgi:two-component system sensor histidine kinase/response regulator